MDVHYDLKFWKMYWNQRRGLAHFLQANLFRRGNKLKLWLFFSGRLESSLDFVIVQVRTVKTMAWIIFGTDWYLAVTSVVEKWERESRTSNCSTRNLFSRVLSKCAYTAGVCSLQRRNNIIHLLYVQLFTEVGTWGVSASSDQPYTISLTFNCNHKNVHSRLT